MQVVLAQEETKKLLCLINYKLELRIRYDIKRLKHFHYVIETYLTED